MDYNLSAVTPQCELSQSTAPRYVMCLCLLQWDVNSDAEDDVSNARLHRRRIALPLQPARLR